MFNMVLDFLFPKSCLGCRKLGTYLCPSCTQSLLQKDLICPICIRPAIGGATHPICLKPYSLNGLWSLAAYTGPIRLAVKKLKYRSVSSLVDTLVDSIIEYWTKYPPFLIGDIARQGTQAFVVTAIPLHPTRQKTRGFNQAELIGRSLAQKMGLTFTNTLVRTRHTKPQVGLTSHDRHLNIQNAFALAEVNVKNLNLILIDDVWTTGSTLREAAKILKRSGARSVWALTIAR